MSAHETPAPVLEPQFGSHAQQDFARSFGMWVFLSSELLFFGPLLFGYLYLRMHYPQATGMASRHTDMLLGTVNTAVLLTSSFCMALAGHAAQHGKDMRGRRRAARLLALTALLGVVFLAIKGYEWHQEFGEHLFPGAGFRPDDATDPATVHGIELFFLLYFAATGLHALHLLIGVSACVWLMVVLRHAPPRGPGNEAVELTGLYWHFVDVVWIFLYPLLYLTARSGG
ncbi:cytochrome c oxidase subunit 3 [Massilia luteola]|jgi:cytochrome c oxidase subunit 3|uniref:cytochrome c oxidase subunit 3 n=1 Tax=Massilia luteola TaxID=3081751 RepID=UPI002ACC3400|nr:cytochrome c oxidase subunit 3 [Massilia sp. Gc5]